MKPTIAVLGALLLLSSCASITEPFLPGEELSWAQYTSIEPGMTATEIRKIYGHPKEVKRDARGIYRFTYLCWDVMEEKLMTVDLQFDAKEVLVKKNAW